MRENALVGWLGRYVSMWALDGGGGAKQYGGRIETVGSDGIVFQPASSPEHTRELPPPAFPVALHPFDSADRRTGSRRRRNRGKSWHL
jgi:hypothetical protein